MNFKNMAKTATVITIAILMASAMLTAMPVQAQVTLPAGVIPTNLQEGGSVPLPAGVTPDLSIDSYAFLSFRPNPVGVGQVFLVNLWVTPALHASRYFKDFTVTITKPDGTKDVIKMDSYRADATAWFEYVADQVGTWKLKFDFPGAYFPPGNYTIHAGAFAGAANVSFTQSVYYKPASTAEQTLTVREEIVLSWPESPLPTDYWTRPAHVEHREWWPILGNWPATGYVGGGPMWDKLYPNTNPRWCPRHRFTPWVQGPNTAHIVWKRQGSVAGLIGGQAGQYGISASPGNPSIIYAGRCYQTVTKPMRTLINGTYRTLPTSVWQCYDLRTGEVYWELEGQTAPTLIEYASPTTAEVPGAAAAGTWSVSLMYIGGGYLTKYSPWTGAVTVNVSISPLTTGTFYAQSSGRGSDPMVLTVQDLGAAAGALRYRLINWTTRGTTTNFTARIVSNTTYARSSLPTVIDYNAGVGATVSGITQAGVFLGMNLTGIDLWTGATLWSKNISEPVYSGSCDIVDHGKLAVLSDRGYYVAFDLWSGKELWKSDKMDYPWSASGFGGYTAMSAYGMFFREAYDGVYAFNWTNGKRVWKYTAPARAAYETPYTDENGTTVYPFYSFGVGGQIADGKFYTWTYEHTESWPVTRGWGIHCIDVFTGKGVWNMTGCIIPTNIADGYLVGTNSYDGYMYVFGKGKSQTTVTAPDVAVPKGTAITIKGTVLDMSPAQPGTPCVSKESMRTQMDYLHMQLPIAGIWGNETITGVPVALTAIGPDGSVIDIGKVTTNGYYGTFGVAWTPPDEGTYEIIASFAGDDSYGSSAASTFITVGPAPEPYPEPVQPEPPIDNTPAIIGTGIAIIIAIIIAVAIATLLILRKRP